MVTEHMPEVVSAIQPGIVRIAWVLPLIMVLSAFITLFVGKKLPSKGPIIGITAIGLCFVASLGILLHFVQGGAEYSSGVPWFEVGYLHVDAGQYVDGLTAIMLLVVCAISLAVHIYSLGYMHGDVRYTWFYVCLSMFTAAMMTVLIAYNLILLLVGWEVMGVCSYLLIGHWYEEKKNSSAAIKAFLTTRVGDVFFMLGIFTVQRFATCIGQPILPFVDQFLRLQCYQRPARLLISDIHVSLVGFRLGFAPKLSKSLHKCLSFF